MPNKEEKLEEAVQKIQYSTYWYPHVNIGNQSPIESENANKNNDGGRSDLENYGAYHFIIDHFPEFDKSLATGLNTLQDTLTGQKDKANETLKKIKDFGPGLSDPDAKGSMASDALDGLESGAKIMGYFTSMMWSGLKVGFGTAKGMVNLTESQITDEKFQEQTKMDVVIPAPTYVYDKQSSKNVIHIYLPFKNYTINRNSGITEQKDVISDIGTAVVKSTYDFMRGNQMMGSIMNVPLAGAGATVRDFVAPRIASPSLDPLEISWNLVPRNKTEMYHIYQIVRYFQTISVPNFSKEDFFYVMPPVMQMEIITRDFVKKEKKRLRPFHKFYVTSIGLAFSKTEGGEVLLSPEGLPMFIDFKINLIKADLTTAEELFNHPFM